MELIVSHYFIFEGAYYCLVGVFDYKNTGLFRNGVFECDDTFTIINKVPIVDEIYLSREQMIKHHKLFLSQLI